jgi:hypothetical protein
VVTWRLERGVGSVVARIAVTSTGALVLAVGLLLGPSSSYPEPEPTTTVDEPPAQRRELSDLAVRAQATLDESSPSATDGDAEAGDDEPADQGADADATEHEAADDAEATEDEDADDADAQDGRAGSGSGEQASHEDDDDDVESSEPDDEIGSRRDGRRQDRDVERNPEGGTASVERDHEEERHSGAARVKHGEHDDEVDAEDRDRGDESAEQDDVDNPEPVDGGEDADQGPDGDGGLSEPGRLRVENSKGHDGPVFDDGPEEQLGRTRADTGR